MIVTMRQDTPQNLLKVWQAQLAASSITVTAVDPAGMVFYLTGKDLDEDRILANEWVQDVKCLEVPYRLACRALHPKDSVIDVGGVKIGAGMPLAVIAGPCAVESKEMVMHIAQSVKEAGASLLRGGAYKPRTSPYAFQGMGQAGILALEEVGKETHMPIVSELMSENQLDAFIEHVDMIQIGARNMQNYDLLKAVGRTKKPILLKRGMAASIEEWIMSAEYILSEGNPNVILCERGIRTFEKYTRNTLDLTVVPIVKEKTHLPIIIDPSHACGNWRYVEAVSLAAAAAGCDGLMIEVHDDPEHARSDGAQSLKCDRFRTLMEKVKTVSEAVGRKV